MTNGSVMPMLLSLQQADETPSASSTQGQPTLPGVSVSCRIYQMSTHLAAILKRFC